MMQSVEFCRGANLSNVARIAAVATVALALFAAGQCALAATPDWNITALPVKKIMANYPADMRIIIVDGKNKPVEGAVVDLAVNMTDMDHGEHKSSTTMTGPGIYEGKVNFFMVGPWALEVRARKGSDLVSKKIAFDIKE